VLCSSIVATVNLRNRVLPVSNVANAPPAFETDDQERLWKLASLDAEQLSSRAESLPDSRYKSSFLTSLELAMMWLGKAVATTGSMNAESPRLPPFGEDS